MNMPALLSTMMATAILLAGTPSALQSLEGTEWTLLQIGGETVPGDAPQGPPTLNLDPENMQAAGTGGCNRYTGGYTLEGEQIRFSAIAATRMMCPEGMDIEDAFFYLLEEARTYAVVESHLELYDADGSLLGRFEPGGQRRR